MLEKNSFSQKKNVTLQISKLPAAASPRNKIHQRYNKYTSNFFVESLAGSFIAISSKYFDKIIPKFGEIFKYLPTRNNVNKLKSSGLFPPLPDGQSFKMKKWKSFK